MSSGKLPAPMTVIEPTPVDMELISGLHTIERVGLLSCLVCYQEQTMYEGGAEIVRVIKRRLCATDGDLVVMVQQMLAYLDSRAAIISASDRKRVAGLHH